MRCFDVGTPPSTYAEKGRIEMQVDDARYEEEEVRRKMTVDRFIIMGIFTESAVRAMRNLREWEDGADNDHYEYGNDECGYNVEYGNDFIGEATGDERAGPAAPRHGGKNVPTD